MALFQERGQMYNTYSTPKRVPSLKMTNLLLELHLNLSEEPVFLKLTSWTWTGSLETKRMPASSSLFCSSFMMASSSTHPMRSLFRDCRRCRWLLVRWPWLSSGQTRSLELVQDFRSPFNQLWCARYLPLNADQVVNSSERLYSGSPMGAFISLIWPRTRTFLS